MNRKRKKLSARFCLTTRNLGRHTDGPGSNGLSLLVKETKTPGQLSKTWSQKIRINRKVTTRGLGSYPNVTLKEARRRAAANMQAIQEGRDPRSGRDLVFQKATGLSFREAATAYIAFISPGWREGSRSRQAWTGSLVIHVIPYIGEKPINTISTVDIMGVLERIWYTQPKTAKDVADRTGRVMKWAIAKGYCDSDPTKKALRGLGPVNTPKKHHKSIHHSLVGDALRTIAASDANPIAVLALKFLALTAVRSGEVRKATWDQIEGDKWTIPVSKNGRPHRVPLSKAAQQVLEDIAKLTGRRTGLIFPSPRGKILSSDSLAKLFRDNGYDAVPPRPEIILCRLVRRNRSTNRSSRSGTSPRTRRPIPPNPPLPPKGSHHGTMGHLPRTLTNQTPPHPNLNQPATTKPCSFTTARVGRNLMVLISVTPN